MIYNKFFNIFMVVSFGIAVAVPYHESRTFRKANKNTLTEQGFALVAEYSTFSSKMMPSPTICEEKNLILIDRFYQTVDKLDEAHGAMCYKA